MKAAITFVLSLAFGALFIWSGIGKVKDPMSFADAIRNYRIVGDPIAPALAHFIPWLEIFAGLGTMIERTRQGSVALLTLLLLIFTLGIISAWLRGLDIACGCFGSEEVIDYPVKVAQNMVLAVIGAWILWASRRR